jgi:hypothetical protein
MVKEDERFLALEGDDKYRLEAFDEFMVKHSVPTNIFLLKRGGFMGTCIVDEIYMEGRRGC